MAPGSLAKKEHTDDKEVHEQGFLQERMMFSLPQCARAQPQCSRSEVLGAIAAGGYSVCFRGGAFRM